jgi:hypothetical protein
MLTLPLLSIEWKCMPVNIAPLLPTIYHFVPLEDKIRSSVGDCQGKKWCEIKKIRRAASGYDPEGE